MTWIAISCRFIYIVRFVKDLLKNSIHFLLFSGTNSVSQTLVVAGRRSCSTRRNSWTAGCKESAECPDRIPYFSIQYRRLYRLVQAVIHRRIGKDWMSDFLRKSYSLVDTLRYRKWRSRSILSHLPSVNQLKVILLPKSIIYVIKFFLFSFSF